MSNNSTLNIFPKQETLKTFRDSIIAELAPCLEKKRIAYLDMPIHLNLGDLLIERGTYNLFNELGVVIWKRVALFDKKRLFSQYIPPEIVLVLHGGGNFGDIYPHHQKFRLDVVECFPDNTIVMLPQSIHFEDKGSFSKQAEILNKHKNIKIFARDQYSYEFLSSQIYTEKLGLLPDMAMMLLDDWEWKTPVGDQTLLFRRKDKESIMSSIEGSFDWNDIVSRQDRKLYRMLKRIFKLQNSFLCNFGAHTLWTFFRDRMINKGVAHFRQYGCIDADRLHAFIIAQLLGLPTICRDNCYGKISRYLQSWYHLDG